MIKEFLKNDPELEEKDFLGREVIEKRNLFLKTKREKDNFTEVIDLPVSKTVKTENRKARKFNSLERIRVVVDGLIGDDSLNTICQKENITEKQYVEWAGDFYDAFNRYAEDYYAHADNNVISVKNQIISKTNTKVFNFFEKYLDDIYSTNTKLVSEKSDIFSKELFSSINNVITFNRVNDLGLINKYFEKVNKSLDNDGLFMGCFETFKERYKKRKINKLPIIKHLSLSTDFMFNRVLPRLPYVKKAYFYVTKGKNRSLSKAEVLGRLVSCGFEIIDVKLINGLYYFVTKKIKEPNYDMNASYGPVFKMQRVGKNGKMIGVYKFRTMHPYSEYLQDYIVKLNGYAESGKPANDFRLVPYGKFLRKYWLDELPQILNFLKGELKLVGARPVSLSYFQDIPKEIQNLRLTQKPGCIPPYVALNAKGSVNSVLQAEKEYLEEKLKNPYSTDIKYFFNAVFNIMFKGKRSA